MRWLAPLSTWDAPFDPAIHCKNPFKVFDFVRREAEGDNVVRTLFEAEVRNFHITDLIGLNQKYYVFSEQLPGDAVPVQVCRGRVNVVPVELGTRTVRLEFVCVPPREDLALRAAAMALAGLPPGSPPGRAAAGTGRAGAPPRGRLSGRRAWH